jgi:surface protein
MISLINIGRRQSAVGGGGAAPVDTRFISEWTVASDGETVTLPYKSGGTFTGTIDWGDTTVVANSLANSSHTYASAGTYTIIIDGDVQGWAFENAGDKVKITDVSNWGTGFVFDRGRMFQGCTNLDITATDVPTITSTTFLSQFYNCDSLTTAVNWSAWDTSTVTNFSLCFAENSAFNGNVANWVHSSVTNVSKMFNNATSFNGDLSSWDVSGVTTWSEFARGATSFNGDVSGWSPSGAMTSVFHACSSFTGTGLDTWNTSGVTSMFALLNGTQANADISGWNTSSVTNMSSMFRSNNAFDQDISSWDINQVTNFAAFMTSASGLSTSNYDALLVAWEAQVPQTGITVDFGGSTFTSGSAAATAKASLQSTYSWIITDGGAV